MRNFLFETKKLFKRKTTLAVFALAILAMVALYMFNYIVAINVQKSVVENIEAVIAQYPEYIEQVEEELKVAQENKDADLTSDLKFKLSAVKSTLSRNEVFIDGFKYDEWTKIYPQQVEDLEYTFEMNDMELNPAYWVDDQGGSWFTVRATLEEKKILNEVGAESFIQADIYRPYIRTVYEKFTGRAVEQWKQLTTRYGVTGVQFLYQMIEQYLLPILILLSCFIFGNTISQEAGKKKRGLNFYAVLPVKKRNVFLSKYLSGLVSSIVFILAILILPVIISLFTKGVGSLKYPILVYEPTAPLFGNTILNPINGGFHFISLGQYLGKTLILVLFALFFVYSLYYLISLFIKNPAVSFGLTSILVLAGVTILPKFGFNPFLYVDTHNIISKTTALLSFNESINFTNGLISLFIFGSLATVLSYMKFARGVK